MSDIEDHVQNILKDLDIEDYHIQDYPDPEQIDIVIHGRLKQDLSDPQQKEEDPVSDYDRAMKGLPCIRFHTTTFND